jgi:hypothetical protein
MGLYGICSGENVVVVVVIIIIIIIIIIEFIMHVAWNGFET